MTTARTIIEASLRKINALGSGESLPAEDAADALKALNAMISAWSVVGDLIYNKVTEDFSLVGGTASYTIGSGQTFNTDRPLQILSMYLTQGGISYPLTWSQIDERQYSAITLKSQQGIPFEVYWYDNYPTGTLTFYYVPNTSFTFHMVSVKPLTSFTSLNTDIDLPPGYEAALIYNLAIELAPEYQREPSNTVVELAGTYRSAISVQNTRSQNNTVPVDLALVQMGQYQWPGWFNIYGGGFG